MFYSFIFVSFYYDSNIVKCVLIITIIIVCVTVTELKSF